MNRNVIPSGRPRRPVVPRPLIRYTGDAIPMVKPLEDG